MPHPPLQGLWKKHRCMNGLPFIARQRHSGRQTKGPVPEDHRNRALKIRIDKTYLPTDAFHAAWVPRGDFTNFPALM